MSDQDNSQVTTLQRPPTDDPNAWKAYWEAQGWFWRTEPEIDVEQQKYLARRRNIKPDIEQGNYPFGSIKLTRADVEWLLATHANGQGPVDWNNITQRERKGLDLRGTDLTSVNLSMLPLARTIFGLNWQDYNKADAMPNIVYEKSARKQVTSVAGSIERPLLRSQEEIGDLYPRGS